MAHTSWSLYMVGKEFTSTNLQTDVMRFTLNFGGPLCKDGVCYKNPETEKDAQNEMFETWAIDTLKDMLDSSDFDDVEVLYFFPVITFQEILNVLMHDGLLALGSGKSHPPPCQPCAHSRTASQARMAARACTLLLSRSQWSSSLATSGSTAGRHSWLGRECCTSCSV